MFYWEKGILSEMDEQIDRDWESFFTEWVIVRCVEKQTYEIA